uniref:NADH-ubiquinone oxidoreductase chain 2 n=1 Tax=Aleurocanthus spiniferus TaxID=593793 RepID=A0A109NM55_ALESP|nr:NADH dehydrogenase subunit 2 [Aleurocanthus spiniferus]AHY04227.1 NADH dehydrogenase subunit 2 [Aleurocanthus spiniferus]
MNYLKFMFTLAVSYLSLISWMVNSWMTLWMVMEVTLVLFMGLLSMGVSYSIVELMIKYFIIQAVAGLVLLGCLAANLFLMASSTDWMMVSVLFVKLGLAPFHSWMISVLGKIDWLGFFIMVTFLKLVPLLMLNYLAEASWGGPVAILSVLVGSFLGINEVQIQKLLGYSGMVSVAWLVLASEGGFFFFFFFWVGYSVSLGLLCVLCLMMNVYYFNQFKFISFSLELKIMSLFLAFSFSGIPPFLGFMMKWGLCYFMMFWGVTTFVWVLVLMSFFSTFYYLQLWYYILLMFTFEFKWYSTGMTSFLFMIMLVLFSWMIMLIYLII